MSDQNINERALLNAMDDGLVLAARAVLELAQRLAPIGGSEDDDRGQLRQSGHLEPEGVGVKVIFDVPYAAKQHEDLRLRHPHGGGPKYLEGALKALMPQLEQFVGTQVISAQKRGIFAGKKRV